MASPDPAGLVSVDPSFPQSWNRYAYVLNNPLRNADANGLYCYYGDTTPGSSDWNDNSQYDFQSTQSECEGSDGTWYPDENAYQSIEVTADPLPDPSGIGSWIGGFIDSFQSLDFYQISADLNQCAAKNADKLYNKVLRGNKVANVLAGNAFAGLSQLAVGPNRAQGGKSVAAEITTHGIIPQVIGQAAGQIPVLSGTTMYSVPGTTIELGGQARWATMVERYTAVSLKATAAFKSAFGFAENVLDGKILLDGGTYLSMEISCTIP